MLQKAQENLKIDINIENLDITRPHITKLNLGLSHLMENISLVCESKITKLGKEIPVMNSFRRSHNSAFLPCQDSTINNTQDTK